LNFLKFKADGMTAKRKNKTFLNGEPMSVEEIIAQGRMPYYFERFSDDLGESFYDEMLGETANYFTHVHKGISLSNSHSFTYESLIDDAQTVITDVMSEALGHQFKAINLDLARVDQQTKGSSRKAFFWQATKGTRFNFLSASQINTFEDKYQKELASIGYV
jgi:hypothetical protein